MRTIDPLKGNNYLAWRKEIDMLLTLADLDYSIQTDRPTEPQIGDPLYDEKMLCYGIQKTKWEFSNTKCLKIVRHLIYDSIEGSIPECTTAKELLERLKSQFTRSSKAYASALVDDFTNTRCDSSGVRAYIHKMKSTAAKLNKYLGKDLPEDFVVHMIIKSLPKEYENFHVHYNTTVKDRWTIDQLMAQCLQEEERLKSHKGDSINYASNQLKKINKSSKPTFKKGPKGDDGQSSNKAPAFNYNHGRGANPNKFFPVPVDTCLYCKQKGHYKKDCPDYLRSLLKRDEGTDQITFIDESLYLDFFTNSWWIDSGATVHVANSLQGFRTRRMLEKGTRSIRVANGKEAAVKGIGDLSLELDNGFVLLLRDVLFVPSLKRNLISVSRLEDDKIHCRFGDQKYVIHCDNKDVGLAIRREMLYLLSQCNMINVIDASEAVPNTNETKKRKRNDGEISLKL
jgi:hypothetical protein